jgi:hypothetical protein
VFGRWAACMKAAGYADATTPAEAYDLVKTNMTSRVVSAREIAVAKADVTCKEKNNVIPIWHGFEVEYEQGEIEKNAQALHQDRLALDAQLQRIATILAQG